MSTKFYKQLFDKKLFYPKKLQGCQSPMIDVKLRWHLTFNSKRVLPLNCIDLEEFLNTAYIGQEFLLNAVFACAFSDQFYDHKLSDIFHI